jgi:hypothetical protein
MRCPRCGADNAEHAERCYLCEYAFTGGEAGVEPPAPDEAARAPYPPPGVQAGVTPQGQQAVPPPPVTQPGVYGPPPPGAYPPGYQPPPPAPKGPATVKIIIGVLIALLVVVVGAGAYFLTRGKTYDIVVSAPPGYEVPDQEMMDELKDTMEESSQDIVVDELFNDASMTNFIIVAHQDIPSTFGSDTPSGDDPEEMEEWFYEHKQEWIDAFNSGIIEGAGVPSGIDLYQVERLATGDAVLHMNTSLDVMGTTFVVETLWVIKGRTAFFILAEGLNPGKDTVEFLKENVTFK